ncbi:MAG: tetraacyldisaccharide 4'-kinase [Bacteroidales bacterium]|nr:tetraacyldisaccharide 4'-kinase [Bacteroidales bacterium]
MNILLLPISFLHHIILSIRHKLYDWHLLKSKRFDHPVICVGNLSLGGTGKTPHTEHLIRLLSDSYRVAVLSRGYGRKTKGYRLASASDTSETLGDEPMLYHRKYPEILVAVDEDRVEGVETLLEDTCPPEVILLDDAFQHRKINAGLNLLLTEYGHLYSKDFLVPAGKLRDVKSAARRADIIVVSKSPKDLDEKQRAVVVAQLKPLPHQKVFFSSIEHEPLKPLNEEASKVAIEGIVGGLLFCGIANPKPLINELSDRYKKLETIAFSDHHAFNENDIDALLKKFKQLPFEEKIMVTTEKDYARIINSPYLCKFDSVPLFAAPIHVNIHQQEEFNKEILDYVRKDHQHG